MVYEANARVRNPVYGCVGAISSLQQQVDVLHTQLALAQAEVVHLRMHQVSSSPDDDQYKHVVHATSNSSSENLSSPSRRLIMSSQSKSPFSIDMDIDQVEIGESLWSC